MNAADTARAVRVYAEAKDRHDLDDIIAAYHPDGTYESIGIPGVVRGHRELRRFFSALYESLPDYRAEWDGLLADEDRAVTWGRFVGTTTERFMGKEVEPGRSIRVPVTFVVSFRDGLVASDVGYFNAETLYRQAGIGTSSTQPEPDFVARFARFWLAPSEDGVAELVAPELVSSWPGRDAVDATEHARAIGDALRLIPDLRIEVVDHAWRGETVFIAWRAQGTIAGEQRAWNGVDRFRVVGGRAVEGAVLFDTAALAARALTR